MLGWEDQSGMLANPGNGARGMRGKVEETDDFRSVSGFDRIYLVNIHTLMFSFPGTSCQAITLRTYSETVRLGLIRPEMSTHRSRSPGSFSLLDSVVPLIIACPPPSFDSNPDGRLDSCVALR